MSRLERRRAPDAERVLTRKDWCNSAACQAPAMPVWTDGVAAGDRPATPWTPPPARFRRPWSLPKRQSNGPHAKGQGGEG